MTRARFPALLCLGFMLAACNGDDVIAESETAGTDSETDTDTSSTTSPTTTLPTTTTNTTTTTTTTSETDTDPTATDTDPTATDTDPTATDTDVTATDTTGPECVENTDCADGEMCTDGMCVPAESTLCDRLGGMPGISTLNGSAVGMILNDQRVNGYFLNDSVDGANLLGCLDNQIGEAAGCPDVVYECADMLTAHAGLGISTQDFTDFAEDYAAALVDHQTNNAPELTDDDITAIMTVLGDMAPDVVEDADSNATVYQRVGRKPAVVTLIGAPGEAESFVDNVANDVEINGFFGNADFVRLNTCLSRQVSSIDGPIVYGGEVDSPGPGIDEGVALDNQCLDMCTSHAGLVDDNDMPITVVDFAALATDLVTAMTTAGVAQEDQDAILGVLGPMCTDIVADPFNCPAIPTQPLEVMDDAVAAAIPDDGYDGSIGSMACANLEVMDPGDMFTIVNNVTLEIGIDHTWVGDLTIKVVSPDNVIHTVLSRPNYMEAADDGNGGFGDSSNLLATSPITFSDGGATDAETLGDSGGSNVVVCQDDNLCDYFGNKGAAMGGSTFAESFLGSGVIGTWMVCVGDSGGSDTGTLQAAKLTFDVSEPVGCP